MPDILDTAFHLPLRKPLADLATFGLVPEPGCSDRGRAAWVALADRRPGVGTKRTTIVMHMAILDHGLTVDGFLSDQLERLRAMYADVAPVRLYLRAPGAKVGSWTRAWMGVPRKGMSRLQLGRHLNELLDELRAQRPDLADHEIGGTHRRLLDRPRYTLSPAAAEKGKRWVRELNRPPAP
jgi:hypothetical protein